MSIHLARKRLTHATELPGLRLRMVAGKGCYITTANCLTPAPGNLGDAIGCWTAQNNPNVRFTQGTGSKQPTLNPYATPNGLPSLLFTVGGAQALTTPAGYTDIATSEHTMLCTFRVTAVPAGVMPIFAGNSTGNWYSGIGANTTFRNLYQNGSAANKTSGSAQTGMYAAGSFYVGAWRVKLTAGVLATGDVTAYLISSNGVSLTTTVSGEGITKSAVTTWIIGGLTVSSSNYDGDIADLDVYGRALSNTEIDDQIAERMFYHGIT